MKKVAFLMVAISLISTISSAETICGKIDRLQNSRDIAHGNTWITKVIFNSGKSAELISEMAISAQSALTTALSADLNVCVSNEIGKFGVWQISSIER